METEPESQVSRPSKAAGVVPVVKYPLGSEDESFPSRMSLDRKTVVYAVERASLPTPSMSRGVRPSAEAAVRSGLAHILFADQPEADAAAIDEYLRSLELVPSPHLADGRLSPAAERGKRLFESDEVGCAKCHPSPLYTDLLQHDVGTQSSYDHHARFDTPTLVECWRTAPYLHDGRYRTIKELIVEGRHGATRGNVDELDERQVDDLAEFVLSL